LSRRAAQAPHDAPTLTRRLTLLLVALLGAHALLAWQLRARGVFTFGDDAAYLLLSRSLRAFSYREVQFIGEPIAARFPPGYPAILAIAGVFGERLGVIAAAGIAFSASGLWAMFDVIRRRWSAQLALLVTGVVAVNPIFVRDAGAIASEGAFMALVLWSLWAADRCESGARRGVVAGATAIMAAMVRSAGVTLPLALGVHWLLRRRIRAVAALAVASAMTVGAWLAWTTLAPRRDVRRSYIDDAVVAETPGASPVSVIAQRIRTNTTEYLAQTAPDELALPLVKRTHIDNVVWVLLIVTLAGAGMASAWRRWNAAVVWFALYALLLAVWPYNIERFLEPLLPLVIAFMIVGAWTIASIPWQSGRWPVVAPAAVGALLAGLSLGRNADAVADAADCDRNRVSCAPAPSLDYVDASIYAATHTPPDARFVAPKNATLYYFAPRQSVFWDEVIAQDSTSFLPFLERNEARFILVTPVYYQQVAIVRLALAHCAQFDLVKAFSPETLILQRRDEPTGPDTPACRALARLESRLADREAKAEHAFGVSAGGAS
jgi:hypothetical protein